MHHNDGKENAMSECATAEEMRKALMDILSSKTDYAIVLRHRAAKIIHCGKQPTSIADGENYINSFENVSAAIRRTACRFLVDTFSNKNIILPKIYTHGDNITFSWEKSEGELLILFGESHYDIYKCYKGIVVTNRHISYSGGDNAEFSGIKKFLEES